MWGFWKMRFLGIPRPLGRITPIPRNCNLPRSGRIVGHSETGHLPFTPPFPPGRWCAFPPSLAGERRPWGGRLARAKTGSAGRGPRGWPGTRAKCAPPGCGRRRIPPEERHRPVSLPSRSKKSPGRRWIAELSEWRVIRSEHYGSTSQKRISGPLGKGLLIVVPAGRIARKVAGSS